MHGTDDAAPVAGRQQLVMFDGASRFLLFLCVLLQLLVTIHVTGVVVAVYATEVVNIF